jgi:hypothetical protein
MASEFLKSRGRVGGSGFTIFTFGGQPIAFCQQVSYTSPQPVGGGASPIQPMDEPYPVEIMTPAAAGMGQVVLNLFELFGSNGIASKVWDRLGLSLGAGFSASNPFGALTPENQSTNFTLTGESVKNESNAPFAGAVDIVDVFVRQAQTEAHKLQIVKIVRPLNPNGPPGNAEVQPYTEEYHGCAITNIQDGEQISVGTMEILKQITVNFCYVTRNGQTSLAFKLRNDPLAAAG